MITEYVEVLGNLKIDEKDANMQIIYRDVITLSIANAEQIINKLQALAGLCNDLRLHPKQPFFCLFISGAHRELHKLQQAIQYACKAANLFRFAGSVWNEAVSRWFLGLLYRDNGNTDRACIELKAAAEAIERLAHNARIRGNYEDHNCCMNLFQQVYRCYANLPDLGQRRALAAPPAAAIVPAVAPLPNQAAAPAPTTVSIQVTVPVDALSIGQIHQTHIERPFPIPLETTGHKLEEEFAEEVVDTEGYLVLPWLPIYPGVEAGKNGPVLVPPPQKGDCAAITQVILDDEPYTVYSMKMDDRQVTFTSGKRYGWAKVSGHSMNIATPVPICEGDYVLFYATISHADEGSGAGENGTVIEQKDIEQKDPIVIVSWPEENKAGYRCIVKRYENSDKRLYSETDRKGKSFDPIRLSPDIRILGVVIAVAKP